MSNLNPLTFEYLKPFKTTCGNIIRMKALINCYGTEYVEDEDGKQHSPEILTPLTPEETRKFLEQEYEFETIS